MKKTKEVKSRRRGNERARTKRDGQNLTHRLKLIRSGAQREWEEARRFTGRIRHKYHCESERK